MRKIRNSFGTKVENNEVKLGFVVTTFVTHKTGLFTRTSKVYGFIEWPVIYRKCILFVALLCLIQLRKGNVIFSDRSCFPLP